MHEHRLVDKIPGEWVPTRSGPYEKESPIAIQKRESRLRRGWRRL